MRCADWRNDRMKPEKRFRLLESDTLVTVILVMWIWICIAAFWWYLLRGMQVAK